MQVVAIKEKDKMRCSWNDENRSKIAGRFELTYLPTISGS